MYHHLEEVRMGMIKENLITIHFKLTGLCDMNDMKIILFQVITKQV